MRTLLVGSFHYQKPPMELSEKLSTWYITVCNYGIPDSCSQKLGQEHTMSFLMRSAYCTLGTIAALRLRDTRRVLLISSVRDVVVYAKIRGITAGA